MNNDLPMCQEMGYNSVYIPNNRTIRQIDRQLSEFIPLVSVSCEQCMYSHALVEHHKQLP